MSCVKVNVNPKEDDLEGLRHLTFQETEGERDIQEIPSEDTSHFLPMKLQKHNIGSKNKHKMASIGDYWDEQTTKEIFDMLHEYEDLFPASVVELK